jgi:hypothetical protein
MNTQTDDPSGHGFEWRIGELLRERFLAKRREMLVQAALMLVLTPAFIVISVFVFVLFIPMTGHSHSYLLAGPRAGVSGSLSVLFGMMMAYFFAAPIPRRVLMDSRWLGASVWSFGVLVAISYLPGVMEAMGTAFWPAFIVLGLFVLASLGLAYEPKEDYYLGWVMGPVIVDNPFTCEDDLDRNHIALGFASAIPALIVGPWSDVFAHAVFFGRWDAEDHALAVVLLHRLVDVRGTDPCEWLVMHGRRRPARVLHALARLGLVLPGEHGLGLTSRGRELLAIARGLRPA